MLVLKRTIQNPIAIRRWFPAKLRVGTIFMPDVVDLPVGQEICLWIDFPTLRVDLYLVGTVLFRRVKAMGKNPDLAAGSGLALRPGHQHELGFLQRLLTHGVEHIAVRRHPRTPLLVPWKAKVVVPHLQMWSPATLTEISLGGARLQLEMMPLHEGAVLQVGLPWHSGTTHHLELAWFRISDRQVQAGLRRQLGGQLSEREWQQLVSRAVEYFAARVRDK